MSSAPGLYEFLIEAELQQYYSGIKNDLKVFSFKSLKIIINIGILKVIFYYSCFFKSIFNLLSLKLLSFIKM